MRCVPFFALVALFLGLWPIARAPVNGREPEQAREFVVSPIGLVRKADGKTTIVLEKRYRLGLLGLEGFSHVYVHWWFDRNDTPEKRAILQIHPSPPGKHGPPTDRRIRHSIPISPQPDRHDPL